MKRIVYFIGALGLILGLQSCFQDFDEPNFNYPASKPGPTMDKSYAEKIFLPFDNETVEDEGHYQFVTNSFGEFTFVDGVKEKAYKGADDAYITLSIHPDIKEEMGDTLAQMGNLAFAGWFNSKKNSGATGIVSVANKKTFWGNFDIFLENSADATEAFFKIHMLNYRTGNQAEAWVEVKIPNFFTEEWQHLAVSYDGKRSTMTIYHNGEVVEEKLIADYGELHFKDLGDIVIGALQFQTVPSQTEGADKQDWAKNYTGLLDEVHLYNQPLSAKQVKALYQDKK